MAKAPRDSENANRITDTLKSLQIDALLCTVPANVLLLSGYWPVMGSSIAIFTGAGEMHLLLPEDEDEIAAQMSEAVRTTFQPASLAQITNARQAIQQPLQQLITRLGLQRSRIGLEAQGEAHTTSYLSQYAYQATLRDVLEKAFSGIQIVSADQLLRQSSAIKSAAQLKAMRLSCNLAGAAYQAAEGKWQQEMTEPAVAETYRSAYSAAALHPDVVRSESYFFCMSGENSAKANAAFARTRQRTIKEGDVVMIHCNSNVNGYWTDITRTYVCGSPDDRQHKMHAAILEARRAALTRIAPGVPAAEVDRAARDVLDKHGFGQNFTHATGHGVGFSAANHDAIPRIHPESPDVLEAGMTFNVEPAIYIEGYAGMRHCDVVAVVDNGVEVLTDF